MTNVLDLASRRPIPDRIAGLIQLRDADIVLLGSLSLDAAHVLKPLEPA